LLPETLILSISSVAISEKAHPYFFFICSASIEEISNDNAIDSVT
jgi:hypothetical protein